jgi:hypothetical protein
MPNLTVFLAPASQKQPGGNPFAPDMFDYRTSGTFNYYDSLNPERRKLIDTLHQLIDDADEEQLAEVFGLEGPMLEEAIEIDDEIYDAPLMSALDRYSPGIMYAAMDFANLPTGAQRRLLENGVIFSGMFGLLRPDDLIPDYRLGMDVEIPGLGPVTEYWRERISAILNENMKGRWIWDLLPDLHRSAWDDEHAYEARAEVQFVYNEDGDHVPIEEEEVDIQRGQFVNYVVRETAEDLEDLREWDDHPDDFVFDEDASSYDSDTKTWTLVMVQD